MSEIVRGDGNIVHSIDIFAKKEYTYVYEDGKIVRATESAIILSGEVVTYKTVLNTIQFVYDSEGQVTRKVIIPADGTARTVYYETDDDNTTVKFYAGGRYVTSHSKTDSFGRKVFDELQFGTDFVSRQFVYHAGEVTQTHKDNVKVKSSATTQLVSQIILSGGRTLSYEYDAEERITKVTDSVDGVTEYTYDALGQLLTETLNGKIVNSMEYDNYGNITKKNGKVYTYDTTWKDLLTSYDGQSITYDAQGNPTSYLGYSLTWEKGRQLKTLVKGTGDSRETYTYTYNANGIRTSKALREGDTASDTRVHKYTLNGTEILRETVYDPNMGGDSILYELYPLRDNEGAVCGIVHRVFDYTETGKIYQEIPYYFQKNLQGDVIAILDREAAIVARYSYDAWGKVLSITDKDGNPISPRSAHIAHINPYRYRGCYYDSETELYYLQSRYYDANGGRFVNSDDYIYTQTDFFGKNLFAYCDNNPVNRIDVSGHFWGLIVLLVVVATTVCGCTKKTEEVKKVIKYDIPLYQQGKTNLCWAYCQLMIESYQTSIVLSQRDADIKARDLAVKIYGFENWNQPGSPTNIGKRIDMKNIEDLYNILTSYGPVYAYYTKKNDPIGHLVVVTGVDVSKNRVYTNNPWGVKGDQKFKKFKKGVAKKAGQSGQNYTLKDIYLVKA